MVRGIVDGIKASGLGCGLNWYRWIEVGGEFLMVNLGFRSWGLLGSIFWLEVRGWIIVVGRVGSLWLDEYLYFLNYCTVQLSFISISYDFFNLLELCSTLLWHGRQHLFQLIWSSPQSQTQEAAAAPTDWCRPQPWSSHLLPESPFGHHTVSWTGRSWSRYYPGWSCRFGLLLSSGRCFGWIGRWCLGWRSCRCILFRCWLSPRFRGRWRMCCIGPLRGHSLRSIRRILGGFWGRFSRRWSLGSIRVGCHLRLWRWVRDDGCMDWEGRGCWGVIGETNLWSRGSSR